MLLSFDDDPERAREASEPTGTGAGHHVDDEAHVAALHGTIVLEGKRALPAVESTGDQLHGDVARAALVRRLESQHRALAGAYKCAVEGLVEKEASKATAGGIVSRLWNHLDVEGALGVVRHA